MNNFSKSQGVSVIVPARNEEENICSILSKIKNVEFMWKEMEIIFISDGSTDKTFELGSEFIKNNFESFQMYENMESVNLGGAFKQGLLKASHEYVIVIQGQDDTDSVEISKIFGALTSDLDLVIPYQTNFRERPVYRWVPSRLFVWIMNKISGLHLQYYNHSVLMKKNDILKLTLGTNSYAYQAEILVKIILSGGSYIEVPVIDIFDNKRKTSAFRLKNLIGVALFLLKILMYRYKLLISRR